MILLATAIAALLSSAPGLSSPPRSAGPPAKAMVKRTPQVDALLATGRLQLIEEYGDTAGPGRAATLLVRGAEEDLSMAEGSAGKGRGQHRVTDRVHLRTRAIETARPENAPRIGAGRAGRLELIQFHGPVKKEWLHKLRSAGGARPIAYIPDNAYIAWVEDPSAIESAGLPLQWREDFSTLDRLSPDLQSGPEPIAVSIQVVRAGRHDAVIEEIRSRSLAVLMEPRDVGQVTDLRVTLPAEAVPELAARAEVIWIEPFEQPDMHDERSDLVSAGLVAGGRPLGPGYLSWLESRGLSDLGARIVDITDTGIDTGGTQVTHPGLKGRVAYSVDQTGEGRLDDCAGHGTNIAGIIAGGAPGDPLLLDDDGYLLGLGMAPTLRVGATRIFLCSSTFRPAVPFTDLVSGAYERGARIGNNSWGGVGGHYNSIDAEYDALARDANRDPADGDQGYLAVFSVGNNGPSPLTITWPSSAKNVLSVGATENYRPNVSDGCGTSSGLADSVDHVLSIGSRGPTADGRFKPDLVAPGSHIQSLASGGPGYTGEGVCDPYYPPGQRLVNWSTGTSQAAAHVTGAAAIASEVYTRRYGTEPSPAMIKAMLINHAHDMGTTAQSPTNTLNRPNSSQGWGRLDLGSLVDARARVVFDQQKIFTGIGEAMTFEPLVVEDPNKPVILTLVWTDAPGTPAGWSWVNDLDLVVESDGVTYLGNVLDRGVSIPGGQADFRNNVEEVVLPAGARTVRATVEAANIAGDGVPSLFGETDQDFAFYASNVRLPESRGEIDFTVPEAFCGTKIGIRLADLGLKGFGRVTAAVESAGDREPMLLDEDPPATGLFSGVLGVAAGAPRPGDGTLQTSDAQPITAIYTEPDPQTGVVVERIATIAARCAAPAVSDVRVVSAGDQEATISWRTEHEADSEVFYGVDGARTSVKYDRLLVTEHSVHLTGLASCESYSATVSSTDAAGVVATSPAPPLRFATGPGSRGRRVIFHDDMEELGSRWTHAAVQPGAVDDWELGFPTSSAPGGFSGKRAWGTNLDGPYSVGADAALTSPPIDLLDAVEPRLTFQHFFSITGGPPPSRNDGGWVEATTDGGATWIPIDPLGAYPDQIDADNPHLADRASVYAGDSLGWTRATFDLSSYSGNLIQIRFHIWQDAGENRPQAEGWYIDDVEVTAQGGCHQARLRLDADQYGCSSRPTAMLSESDLNLNPAALDTARVSAASGTDRIDLVLTETAVNSGEFRGTLPLRSGPGPGALAVSEGATLSITYADQNTGDGTPATLTASALIADCTAPPAPTGVTASADGQGMVRVAWEPVDSAVAPDLQGYRIHYDNDGSGPTYQGTEADQGISPIRMEATVASASLTSLGPCSHHFITVTAFDRFGNESPFAPESVAVPSGSAPCASGRLTAGPTSPGCRQTLTVSVLDANADPDPFSAGTVAVAATTSSQPGEVIVSLTETSPASGQFSGTLQLAPGPQQGALVVTEGDRVTLRYEDLDDGRGATHEATGMLTVADCTPPVISNIRVTRRAGNRALAQWDTNEPATATVRYGFDPSLELTVADPPGTALGTSHALPLSGLSPCSTIYFSIRSADTRGNLGTMPAQGAPSTFGTYREQPIYRDDFEAGAPGWQHSGMRPGSDEWELGTPDTSVPRAPHAAFSGSAVWGTDLDGRYDLGADMVLVSPPLDLTEAEAATLTFMHWYDITTDHPGAGWDDGGFLEASVDDGATWTHITPQGGYPDIVAPNPYTADGAGAYAGSTNGWVPAAFTMDSFVGHVVRVRFHLVQDFKDFTIQPGAGWYIDDVALSLAVACHEGRIEMDQSSYACVGQTIRLQVFDADLDVNAASPDVATAQVRSDTEPSGEVISLAETGPSTGIFEGTLSISTVDAPGILQVGQDDSIVASYDDADDGTGRSLLVTATAVVPDCSPPLLSGVRLIDSEPSTFRVEWQSSEPGDSRVLFGADPSLSDAVVVPGLGTAHDVTVSGLSACTRYFYTVASADAGGNLGRDDLLSGLRSVLTARTVVLVEERFEAGAPGWRHGGQGDTWDISVPGAATTAPTSSYSRPAGGVNSEFMLISPPFDLAGIDHPRLSFLQSYDFATTFRGGDGGWIEAWDGYHWTSLKPDGGYPGLVDLEAGTTGDPIPGFSGQSPQGLTQVQVDLSAVARSLVSAGGGGVTRIRFHAFVEDGIGPTGAGWLLDDVVISGDAPCHLGRLSFGAMSVACAAPDPSLSLTDVDLDLDPAAADQVTVMVESSGSSQPIPVGLVETSPSSGAFAGAVPISLQGDPGTLRAAAGDRILATYEDPDDGTGTARSVTATLRAAGCAGPTISRITMTPSGGDQYLIRWSTDRPSTSEARLEPATGPALVASDTRLATSHQLRMRGLAPCAAYTVTLASEDADGLRATAGGPGGGLLVENTQREIRFADDMEGPDPGWTVSGFQIDWQRGVPLQGPATAFSGTRVFATDLNGRYKAGANETLTSPPIDLIGVTGARLTFWHWYEIFANDPPNSQDDAAFVEVKVAGASEPVYIEPIGGYPDTSDSESGQPLPEGTTVYAGQTVGWENAVFDLSPFDGKVITLRFRLWNDYVELLLNGATGFGWYLDDVEVSTSRYCQPAPSATSLSIQILDQGGASSGVAIAGSGFRTGAMVALGTGLTVTSATVVSPSRIDVDLSADPRAGLGPRDLTVTNPDGQTALLPGALRVTFSPRRADADGSGRIDGNDLAILAGAFASVEGEPGYLAAADLNGDGIVDGIDLAFLAANFGAVLP
jgi:hypothetical protein